MFRRLLLTLALIAASLTATPSVASAHSANKPYQRGDRVYTTVYLHTPAEVHFSVYANNPFVGGFGRWQRGSWTTLKTNTWYWITAPCTPVNTSYTWEVWIDGRRYSSGTTYCH